MADDLDFSNPAGSPKPGAAPAVGPLLDCRGVSKRFGDFTAVDTVDLTLADRRLHALIGPNGAGKTTLFNAISGMYPPDGGSIVIDGRRIGEILVTLSMLTPDAARDGFGQLSEACRRHGVVAGIHNNTAAYALTMIEAGYRFVTLASDARFLAARAGEEVTAVRKSATQAGRLPAY